MNARLRPTISPTLPPVIISDAITSVYIVIAVWIPVTVVSRSSATVAIAVFITVVSRAINRSVSAGTTLTSSAGTPSSSATSWAYSPSLPSESVVRLSTIFPVGCTRRKTAR